MSAPTRLPGAPASAGEADTQAIAVDPDGFPVPTVCAECGGAFLPDGYCEQCGARAPRPRDYFTEHPAPWVAGACDRGVRHTRNEDAMALATAGTDPPRAILVVCDGVSTAVDSDVASLAAARAAREVLAGSRARGVGTAASQAGALRSSLSAAAGAAQAAVVATARGGSGNPPSCTYAAAVLAGDLLVTGCVGDSRVYWVPDTGSAEQLTTDDSWAAHQMAAGMSREEAEAGPHAHAITRWLGPDSPDHEPTTAVRTLSAPGWVVACSDGLWNYASGAEALAEQVRAQQRTDGADPLALAEALVAWANEQGGQDNVTVALARFTPAGPTAEGETDPGTRAPGIPG